MCNNTHKKKKSVCQIALANGYNRDTQAEHSLQNMFLAEVASLPQLPNLASILQNRTPLNILGKYEHEA